MRGPMKQQSLGVLRQRQVPVRTVIDVGVLNGTFELIAAYPNCPHLLFEPVIEFAASIEANYRAVPHKLIQAAVSDRSGSVSLTTATYLPGFEISASSMVDAPAAGTRTVPMVTLDEYLLREPAEPPFFLKVDIDGHEMKVLNGAAETLKQTSIVMIEATADALPERIGFLLRAGFQLFDLAEPSYYDDCFAQCDAIFIRADLYPRHFATMTDGFDYGKWTAFIP